MKIILLMITAILLTSCGKTAKNEKTSLAFVTNGPADFWLYCQAGVEKAGRELGVDVQFKVGDMTTAKQKQIVDDLLVSGVQGVAISPASPKDQKQMINDWASYIPVICADSDSSESNRLSYLGTDNIAAGRQCGELLKEALPNGGKVMVFVGLKDAQNAQERFQGLKEAVAGTKIEILDLRTDNGDRVKARKNAEDTITTHEDIAGMVGLWAYNAPAILGAVESAGKVGEIQIISFDEDPVTLKAIDEGKIFGTICQDPYTFGYESIKLLHKLVGEGKSAAEAGIPANKQIIIPTKALRKGEGMAYKKYCDDLKKNLADNS
jgi:ribose transport system substrate-binding protein